MNPGFLCETQEDCHDSRPCRYPCLLLTGQEPRSIQPRPAQRRRWLAWRARWYQQHVDTTRNLKPQGHGRTEAAARLWLVALVVQQIPPRPRRHTYAGVPGYPVPYPVPARRGSPAGAGRIRSDVQSSEFRLQTRHPYDGPVSVLSLPHVSQVILTHRGTMYLYPYNTHQPQRT